jgi:hypothetical protein
VASVDSSWDVSDIGFKQLYMSRPVEIAIDPVESTGLLILPVEIVIAISTGRNHDRHLYW